MRGIVFLAVLLVVVSAGEVNGKRNIFSSMGNEELVEQKLKSLNKPAVKSIKSEDGDIIDCVDIYKQPAFDHPLLKNHKIKSVALLTSGYSYIGAKANINIWNPRVEADDEYTTGQMWLRNGPYNDSDSIELGWMVNPSVYGDRRTRLFIYWTVDSGKTLGCFDLLCPGFVQLSSKITLGAPIEPVSTAGGPQYQIPVEVIKDNKNEAWWFIYDYNITVGYWPTEIFRSMNRIAALVEWGGDVYTPRLRSGGPHTATAMGSGAFANEHWGYSSFIQQPRIMDYSSTYKYPQPYGAYTPARNCYSGENYASKLFTEPLFYFGGPGRNMYCP